MAMTSAERQSAYRERKRARMAEDPEYAAEVKAKKAESDRKWYEGADKVELNKKANDRYHKKMASDPEYVQYKRDEALRYYEAHRDEVLIYKKNYREQNAEKISEYMAQWELENRDKRYALNYKRRMIIEGSVEIVLRSEVWERDQGVCCICYGECDPQDWHLDHVTPLSKGGSHTMDNVQVSHPKCNLSKGATIIRGG